MKKGPLSKIEAHYINTKTDLTDEQIAADLGRSVELVKENRIVVQPRQVTPFMQATRGHKSRGVAISSEAASVIGDDSRNYNTREYKKNVGKVFPD